jgi:dipeptidyl aminopeptidase/acylaminoacyl peptidase
MSAPALLSTRSAACPPTRFAAPRRLVRAVPLLLILSSAAAAAAPAHLPAASLRPSAADFVQLAAPSDLALSADGRWAAFALSRATRDTAARPSADDRDGGWKRTRQIVLLDLTSRASRTLTSGDERAGTPRFAPDGRSLAFVRKSALWLLPLTGGEARRLDTGKLEPDGFRFSPDGRTIAFLAPPERSAAEVESAWRAGGAFAWDDQWRRSRLWTVPIEGGTPRAVSPESLNVSDFEWSPDGRRLAVLTTRDSDPYEVFNFPQPRVLDATDGRIVATLARRTDSYGTAYGELHWTPDSHALVLTGLNGGLSNVNALLVWDVASGAVRDLAPNRDLTLDGLALVDGGRDVIVCVKAGTESQLLRFALAGGPPRSAGFAGRVVSGALLADASGRKLAFVSSTPLEPADVTVFDPAARRTEVVSKLNPQTAGWAFGETQVVRWKCPEGVTLEGLLTRPPGAAAGAASALVVLPHGGPDDVTQQGFSAQAQLFASRGYAVFRPNYRGGTGYGFAFYAANRNRFGTIEQMDIESGVDTLLARRLADPERLYFGGWSWGGYLTAWTIGHVHRYRAAVVGAGVNDVSFSYSSSDINHGVASQWEYQGDPWREPEHFDRANPLRYAKDMTTPTLILHGQSDDRVNFLNGVSLYRALSDVGCEVKFYAYPREPHGFEEPAHLVHRLDTWLRWYDQHGGPVAARP